MIGLVANGKRTTMPAFCWTRRREDAEENAEKKKTRKRETTEGGERGTLLLAGRSLEIGIGWPVNDRVSGQSPGPPHSRFPAGRWVTAAECAHLCPIIRELSRRWIEDVSRRSASPMPRSHKQ